MKLKSLNILRAPVARAGRAWRRRRQPHGIVLAYHRVAEPRIDPWQLCVSPKHFAQHLESIAEFADIVPLRELEERVAGPRGRRPPVAITFDDGYLDNLNAALPVLQRYGAPATIFLSTGWTGRQTGFWWDRLADLVLGPPDLPAELDLARLDYCWRAGRGNRRQERARLLHALWQRLRDLDDDVRDELLERLAHWAAVPAAVSADARPMNEDEVARLAASPLIEIGAHSVTHRSLPALPELQRQEEMRQSRLDCERLTGRLPESFAYPFGDHFVEMSGELALAGFARACSTRQDLVWPDADRFRLPRIVALDYDGTAFGRRLRREWLP